MRQPLCHNTYSSKPYYPFGMIMPGRSYNGTSSYRFGFNGKEDDNEIKGDGNSLDFGARIYDPRLGRWLGLDVKASKYPGYSPYHFGYDNPIIVIDPNGEENIVVVGNQGNSPDFNDKKDGKYKYGENTRHFLEAGLNEAIRLKKYHTENNEATTMVVYKGNYTKNELSSYEKRAKKAGIIYIEVSNDNQIADYVNYKDAHHDFWNKNERTTDLVTDFSFVGHGKPDRLWVGYDAGAWNQLTNYLTGSDFQKEAFDLHSNINLNSCGSAFGELFKDMKALTQGTVTGMNTTVLWGGSLGLGKYMPNSKEYYYPSQDRDSPLRKTLPENERTKTEKGTRTE